MTIVSPARRTRALPAAAALAAALLMPSAAGAQSFSNEEMSCVEYGDWAVREIRRAQSLGCNVQRANEVLDPRFHMNWCMRQTNEQMRRASLIHTTGVAHRCAQQGVDVRRR